MRADGTERGCWLLWEVLSGLLCVLGCRDLAKWGCVSGSAVRAWAGRGELGAFVVTRILSRGGPPPAGEALAAAAADGGPETAGAAFPRSASGLRPEIAGCLFERWAQTLGPQLCSRPSVRPCVHTCCPPTTGNVVATSVSSCVSVASL